MGMLNQVVSRVAGGARRTPRTGGVGAGGLGTGRARTGGTGRRPQDEAIGRGVRGLLRRFR
ncbi:hypothetical protein [Nocardioides deserti]|uniref:Uncharacterized protein n=1 Tax=Nocardioides deserti TaxID=1588644 RepID=A0ABR6U7Z0_9ACTN|nr:hypothetical protein [Nocardioides deserti]MBC2960400.1 hypothetical protein [Nocardioides deserti]GGO71505.1 hypothetical protein GCM10012276_12630 [Nocardioides deserti]